jgi:hypothetical protein
VVASEALVALVAVAAVVAVWEDAVDIEH